MAFNQHATYQQLFNDSSFASCLTWIAGAIVIVAIVSGIRAANVIESLWPRSIDAIAHQLIGRSWIEVISLRKWL